MDLESQGTPIDYCSNYCPYCRIFRISRRFSFNGLFAFNIIYHISIYFSIDTWSSLVSSLLVSSPIRSSPAYSIVHSSLNKPKIGYCLSQNKPLLIDVVKISAPHNHHNLAIKAFIHSKSPCLKPMPDEEIALEYLNNARDHLGETDQIPELMLQSQVGYLKWFLRENRSGKRNNAICTDALRMKHGNRDIDQQVPLASS